LALNGNHFERRTGEAIAHQLDNVSSHPEFREFLNDPVAFHAYDNQPSDPDAISVMRRTRIYAGVPGGVISILAGSRARLSI
jgi:hypothetical protein